MAEKIAITAEDARKVITVVDQGLSPGKRKRSKVQGEMCVEAAVCCALGLPHDYDPGCVSSVLRSLIISLNDRDWSSKEARAQGLRRLAVAQLGSKDHLDEKEFVRRLVDYAIRKSTPKALRAAASVIKDEKHKAALCKAANRCEKEGTRESALAARKTAAAASGATDAAAIRADAAAIRGAADFGWHRSNHAADAAAAAYAYAYADADFACEAAYVSKKSTRDEYLANYAEDVVQILIDINAPGCQWLHLTEAA